MRALPFFVGALLAGTLGSCASGGGDFVCGSDLDCGGGRCVDSRCVGGSADAGPAREDASVDASVPSDAAVSDGGPLTSDAGSDAGPPPACTVSTDCTDSSVCTTDECAGGACVFAPVDCDDSDACTADLCDPVTGCASTPLSCDDSDMCTTDLCDAVTGCDNVPVVVPGGSCANPIDISAGGTFSGDSSCSGRDYAGVCFGGTGPDTAFVFDLASESMVSLDASATSFTPVLFLGSSCGDESRACESSGSGTLSATLPAGRYFVGLDGRLSSDAGAWSLSVTMAPVISDETLSFPRAGDTRVYNVGDRFWNAGDFVQGARTSGLSSIRSAALSLSVSPNGLSCDTQDMQLRINGTVVGPVILTSGATTVTPSFTFPAISGPTYTIRLETTRTVNSGCGSAGLPDGVSTIRIGG